LIYLSDEWGRWNVKSVWTFVKTINLTEITPYALIATSLFGIFFFQITSTVLVSLTDGMNFIRDAISILVYLPYGFMQTIAFHIFGVSILALAVMLYFRARVKFNMGALMFFVMGIGLFLVGTFPTRLPGMPPTLVSNIHSWATRVVVLAFPLACFFIAPVLKSQKFRYLYFYTLAAAVLQVVFIIFGALFLQGLTGIYERVLLWNGQIWIVVICINLLLDEVRHRLSESSWNRLAAQLAVAGILYAYAAILLPMCLPLITY
jgi:hypothetical protein